MERKKRSSLKISGSLQKGQKLEEVLIHCHRMNSSGKENTENIEEIRKILSQHFQMAENEKHKSELIKAIAKFDDLDLTFTKNILNSEPISEILQKLLLNTAIISNFEKSQDSRLDNDEVQFLLDVFLHNGYKSELKYLDVFAETLSLLCRQCRVKVEQPYQIFQLVMDYFDIPNQHINSALLDLFKNFIQLSLNSDYREMLCRIIGDLLRTSWCSKKKYILIASIMSLNVNVITSHPDFKVEDFLKGLEFSLTLSHLLSPGQTLHASICRDAYFSEILAQHLAGLIWTKNRQTLDNIIKHRFSISDEEFRKRVAHISQEKISKIEKSISVTSSEFKLILRMKTFFNAHLVCEQIDELAKNFSCTEMDCSDKIIFLQYLFEMSIHHPNFHQQNEFILILLSFIRYNMNEDNSTFVDCFIKTFPRLLSVFERKKFKEQPKNLKEIFQFLNLEIIQHGFNFGSYQTTSCSLKVLRLILKQYFTINRTTRKKPTNSNFGQFLTENRIFINNKFLIPLLKLIENEDHSDVSEIGIEILLEFFWDEQNFILVSQHSDTIHLRSAYPEINNEIGVYKKISSLETLRLEILKRKGEYNAELKNSIVEIELMINSMKSDMKTTLSNELKQNPTLFEKLGSLNYLLKICDGVSFGLLYQICRIYNEIAEMILNILNDSDTPMTFEILYQKMHELKRSSSIEHSKDDIVNFMFYTLRACSEFSVMIIDHHMLKENYSSEDFEPFGSILELVIDINTKILTRCCHKGAIEAAREAIGKITRCISTHVRKTNSDCIGEILHKNLRKLDACIFYDYSKVQDIRAARGLMFMIHEIISSHPQFVEKFMFSILTDEVTFSDTIHPLQLHILAKLIRDSKITSNVMTKYDQVLYATVRLFKTAKEYVIINGLLQVLGNLVPKISIQKRHIIESEFDNKEDSMCGGYEHKDISVRNFKTRFCKTFTTAKNDLLLEAESFGTLPQTYIIVTLQILTAFENSYPMLETVDKIMEILFKLMYHRCEKIRMLSAKCASLWIEERTESSQLLESNISNLFTSNENLLIATTRFLTLSILRFCNSIVIDASSLILNLKSIIKLKLSQHCFQTSSFYARCYLLDFLVFLGFEKDDDIIHNLKCSVNVKTFYGYNLWREKMRMIDSCEN